MDEHENCKLEISELQSALAEARRQLEDVNSKAEVLEYALLDAREQLAASQERERVETARLDYLIEHFIDFAVQPSVAEFREDIDKMMKQDEVLRALPEPAQASAEGKK